MLFIILAFMLMVSCTPVQELYLSTSEELNNNEKTKVSLEDKEVISIDTLTNSHETVIRVRYREKK